MWQARCRGWRRNYLSEKPASHRQGCVQFRNGAVGNHEPATTVCGSDASGDYGHGDEGERETIDESWPLVFRTLMQACWDADPTKRPTAEKVGDEFEAALRSVESVPKVVPKSAAELEVEQLREQLKQAELEKQQEAKQAAQAQKLRTSGRKRATVARAKRSRRRSPPSRNAAIAARK